MTDKQIGGLPVSGRKSAYVLRNRQGIVAAAQEVLANQGAAASIEELAQQAEVSVSTLYKHFANKEDLVTAAFQSAMGTWEAWMQSQLSHVAEPLERLVMPMRLFVQAKNTHPVFASMVAKNPSEANMRLASLGQTLRGNLQELNEVGVLKFDDVELRAELLMALLVHISQRAFFDEDFAVTDADNAIALALELLGIDPREANRLVRSS